MDDINEREGKFTNPLTYFDWIIFWVLGIICFLCFQQGDILHTGGSSFAYLNGHILDFYEYNKTFPSIGGNAYLPSTYILFAIWNIPIRLLGLVREPSANVSYFVLMWYKLLPTMIYMISGYLITQICSYVGMGTVKSKLCGFAFLTAPIGFFSQFIFGQYDIFTVFFILLGIYFYYKDEHIKFILFFGIAITFKYFALLLFIPLLLLREKRIWNLIVKCAFVIIPFLIEVLIYFPSQAFKDGVFGFAATNYIFQASIKLASSEVSLVVVVWILICVWAYFKDLDNSVDLFKWSLYFICIIMFLLFGLSMWHPQWLLLGVPFWVMSTFINKRFEAFIYLDIIMMLLFVMFTINYWPDYLDQNLFNLGLLQEMVAGKFGIGIQMNQIFLMKNLDLIFSFFSAIVLVNAVFKHPSFCVADISESISKHWNAVRLRFIIGVLIFVIPAFICFMSSVNTKVPYINTLGQEVANIGPITEERQIAQVFTAEENTVSEITVKFGTYGRESQSEMEIILADNETEEILFEQGIQGTSLVDNKFKKIDLPDVPVEIGRTYKIELITTKSIDDSEITIYRTSDFDETNPKNYAIVDEKKETYNLSINVYGKLGE